MITNICLLLEALSVAICLHCLYGEKFRLDISTTSFLAVNMIIMTGINYYGLPQICTMITYPIIFLYCGMRFGFKLKAIIVNNILYMAIMSGIQLIVLLLYYAVFRVQFFSSFKLLAVNCMALLIVVLVLPRCRLDKVSLYLQDKERIYVVALCISIAAAGYILTQYKKIDSVGLLQSILLFICIIFICFLVFQLGKVKIKAKEIETEFKMHRLYADSFQNLIENIRLRQHEFDNHINTILGLRYTYCGFEELVKAQEEYSHVVRGENRYNKLLTKGNPIIIGFLYGKFVEIEKCGIELSYSVNIGEMNVNIPIYRLIEILGNLINNAVDALKASTEEKRLVVSARETDGEFEIEVRNTSPIIALSEIEKFFIKDYSKKGSGRGLGLCNVKSICEEYKLNIAYENKDLDHQNWLSFKISNHKITAK